MSRRVKKKSAQTDTMSSKTDVPEYNRDVYGHLRNKSEVTEAITEGGSSTIKIAALVMGGIIVFSMGMAGVFQGDFWTGGNDGNVQTITKTGNTTPLVQLCVQHEDLGVHWHYDIRVFMNGAQVPIEPNVGIDNSCMHALHTHDQSGKVHLELPADWQGTPRLGDFFEIWESWSGQEMTLSGSTLMGVTGSVTLKSDGFDVTMANPGQYILGASITGSDEVIELYLVS